VTAGRRGPARPAPFPRARKRFGQHFLEPAWVARLVEAVAPGADETFLEIGPGRGALTVPLASRAGRVIAVEIDRDLSAALPSRVPENVTVIAGDILDLDLQHLLAHAVPDAGAVRLPARVVGNLPYNISSPILFRLLKSAGEGRLLRDATVMLQHEVAARLAAAPGTADYGVLAIQVGLLASVERLFTLPPGAFRPPPKVTSAVVRLSFGEPRFEVGDMMVFEQTVRGVFLQRRKTIVNALDPVARARGHSAAAVLRRAGIDPGLRPGDLTLEAYARLSVAML
jgi:16S rRNA (adenine1518-N6/adenine1519-N6)-dimethyltransferase